ncbi:M56 family metallopeptidase [Confluentibacter lentus]|uniref:M56 family metallopeptidase n=1 Tax=Confluentibacter lentus TaxID=1699412 RepID=UPI000C28573E|nr:M56 family metallopeptidase [Confluentibacter lentus]
MEFYILKSGTCLAIFYGFYKLVLEKESFHVFKRFYLLVSAVLAFVIPLITFTEYIEVVPQEMPLFFQESSITHTVIKAKPINYMPIILWSIYCLGVLLFSFKFLKNLSGIIYRIKRNPKFKNQSFINVLLQDLVIPHTFLSYIFLNKHKFEMHQIPKEVLLHEETHAKQKHSLDVLFIEILQILFWFNPLIYFIKHSIKLNHEFLADHAVLKQGVASSTYQNILLAFSSSDSYRDTPEPRLANAINYSSIKKRFTVMKTHTSKQAFWLRSLILLPLLALLIYSFSEKQIVEKPFVVQQNTLANGVTETMMKEYRDFINDFESSNRIIYPKYLRAVAIYDLMTEEQRNSVKKYPENIISNLSNIKPKTPTEAEFNSWKDSNKFAIWIDGTHVKNSELNNYNASDIKYFTNSFVHDNARSEKFPQPYQNHLYTEKGFDTAFTNAEKDHSVLDEIKKELLKGASQEEIEEYNNLIKQLNSKPEKERIIKVKDKNRIEYIYGLMTDEQKKENESFPDFLTVAPPPQPYQQKAKNGNDIYIAINEIGILIVNKNIVQIRDLKGFLNDLTKDLTKEEKEKIAVNLVSYEAPDEVLTRVKSILRESVFLKINITKSQQKVIEMPMSSQEQKANKKIIDDYLKEHPEALRKIKSKSGETIEIVEIPNDSIPPPPPPVEKETDDHSKESLEARKKFLGKAHIYGEAMQGYFKEKKGNLDDLKKQYKEVMELYNSYQKLLGKENVLPPPPPPPAKN